MGEGSGNLPARKHIRLRDYDYSLPGAYFVTICTKDRKHLLGDIVGANCVRPLLSDMGKAVDQEIARLPSIYHGVSIDKYVIMPNHIHMLVVLEHDEGGRTKFAPTVSRIVKQFKGAITKRLGFSIWQRSFFDHVIRGEKDYLMIWQYIDENPLQWDLDRYNPQRYAVGGNEI